MKNLFLQLSLPLVCVVWLLAGCSQIRTMYQTPPPPPEVFSSESPPSRAMPVQEKPFTHKVRWHGETLSRISWWYTGAGRNWPAIAEANPSLDPRRIVIGDLIIIPKQLLKTREPMAEDYRHPGAVKDKRQQKVVTMEAPALQEVELFGPVDSFEANSETEKTEANLSLESLD